MEGSAVEGLVEGVAVYFIAKPFAVACVRLLRVTCQRGGYTPIQIRGNVFTSESPPPKKKHHTRMQLQPKAISITADADAAAAAA